MKSATIVLSLLASSALAQPHKQPHRHQHKRAQAVKWVTEWAVETEIVAVTETVWVSEGFVPPTTLTASSTTTTNAPAQFFQPLSSKSKASPSPAPSSSSVYVAPPPVSTPEPSSTTTTTTPAPKPTEQAKAPEPEPSTTTTTTPPPPAPTTTPVQAQPTTTSVYVAPAAPSSSAAPVQSSPPSSGGSPGECSKSSPCTGDITYYDAGLGACGWESDGDASNVVALPHGLMGTQSNGNPYCGRKVTVTLNGKSVVAEVVDKCMGCEDNAIDLSNAAFKALADMGVGRTQASWYFSD